MSACICARRTRACATLYRWASDLVSSASASSFTVIADTVGAGDGGAVAVASGMTSPPSTTTTAINRAARPRRRVDATLGGTPFFLSPPTGLADGFGPEDALQHTEADGLEPSASLGRFTPWDLGPRFAWRSHG